MIQIINGKRYNTETATQIAEYSSGGRNDYNGIEETLYRTKSGIWFIEYWGGAASKYAAHENQYSHSDAGIIVYSDDEAYSWLEKNQEIEALETYFSDRIQDA